MDQKIQQVTEGRTQRFEESPCAVFEELRAATHGGLQPFAFRCDQVMEGECRNGVQQLRKSENNFSFDCVDVSPPTLSGTTYEEPHGIHWRQRHRQVQ